jgi:hypothetical protein
MGRFSKTARALPKSAATGKHSPKNWPVGAYKYTVSLAWRWAARTKVLSGAAAKAGFSFGDGAALAL